MSEYSTIKIDGQELHIPKLESFYNMVGIEMYTTEFEHLTSKPIADLSKYEKRQCSSEAYAFFMIEGFRNQDGKCFGMFNLVGSYEYKAAMVLAN